MTKSRNDNAFPPEFAFGAAASSYQIEGAWNTDGKGASVWDAFCDRPGTVLDGSDARVACDHYHRYAEDVELMRTLGLQAYRFSISWARVIPTGAGAANQAGLDFYDRLVDSLLGANIEPYATLFHWDYPLELYYRGGWLNPDSPRWFADYADLVSRRLGDRITHWITLNEPQVFVDAGHRIGRHAPGLRLGLSDVLRACHHALLGHGLAVHAVRANIRTARVGIAPVVLTSIPATDSPQDLDAAREHMFATTSATLRTNAWWLDPLLLGRYPADGARLFGAQMLDYDPGDMAVIAAPLDFVGANIYDGVRVRRGDDGRPAVVAPAHGAPTTAMGWPVTPAALYYGPTLLFERYGLPIAITENGLALPDWADDAGNVSDNGRADFIARHLRELRRAIADGVPMLGYFHWSILDNFEWAYGYQRRFGLVHVDFATQARTLKQSARYYAAIIASRGRALDNTVEAQCRESMVRTSRS